MNGAANFLAAPDLFAASRSDWYFACIDRTSSNAIWAHAFHDALINITNAREMAAVLGIINRSSLRL
jgi:hypothetical protein